MIVRVGEHYMKTIIRDTTLLIIDKKTKMAQKRERYSIPERHFNHIEVIRGYDCS